MFKHSNIQTKDKKETVYHPFISNICQTQYDYNSQGPIPDTLQAVSWMDGANGQLKLITSEENILLEKELKITCRKHLAARTATEQAADAGPNFKLMKKEIKAMNNLHLSLNPVLLHLQQVFEQLECDENDQVVKLKSHKKKAILATVPNLPAATGMSYSVDNVRNGFICNGQLDAESTRVLSYQNLLHTYRGNIKGACLENRGLLMDNFFKSMYFNGVIDEAMFDEYDVLIDTNSKGEAVVKSNSITMDNRHRAKILTSNMQVSERCMLIDTRQMKEYEVNRSRYESEMEDVSLNRSCEGKFVEMVIKANPDILSLCRYVEYKTV